MEKMKCFSATNDIKVDSEEDVVEITVGLNLGHCIHKWPLLNFFSTV